MPQLLLPLKSERLRREAGAADRKAHAGADGRWPWRAWALWMAATAAVLLTTVPARAAGAIAQGTVDAAGQAGKAGQAGQGARTPDGGLTGLPGLRRVQPAPAVGCLIEPDRTADVGSPVTGVIAQVLVDRGDAVREGQPLIVLEHGVEQAGLQAAHARAATLADVHAAAAALSLARQKVNRYESLTTRGFVSPQALEQARAESEVAQQRLTQARHQRQVLAQELDIVRAQVRQRTLRSPFNGVVADRFVNAGERVEDRPLVRVAQLDPLRVELVLPATRWGTLQPDDTLVIVPELPGAGPVQARVSRIDQLIDPASNTFRVRLSLPNPDHRLPAGARCRLDGDGGAQAATATPRGPGA